MTHRIGMIVRLTLLALALAGLPAGAARAQIIRPPERPPKELDGVDFAPPLGTRLPLGLPFRDESGADVRLGDYFGAKPVLVVLAYYRCPMLCTLVLNGVADCARRLAFEPGRDYQVVVVSFDPAEGPDLAAAKKRAYVEAVGRPGAEEGWHFLTGSREAIDRLTAAAGFRYRWDERAAQYAHASGLLVVTADGTMSRFLPGVSFAPSDARLALVEAADGRIGTPVDNALLLFCFQYNPVTGKYQLTVLSLLRLAGVLTVLTIFVGFLWLRRAERRRALRATPAR
jgi:protein SCO1/2